MDKNNQKSRNFGYTGGGNHVFDFIDIFTRFYRKKLSITPLSQKFQERFPPFFLSFMHSGTEGRSKKSTAKTARDRFRPDGHRDDEKEKTMTMLLIFIPTQRVWTAGLP